MVINVHPAPELQPLHQLAIRPLMSSILAMIWVLLKPQLQGRGVKKGG